MVVSQSRGQGFAAIMQNLGWTQCCLNFQYVCAALRNVCIPMNLRRYVGDQVTLIFQSLFSPSWLKTDLILYLPLKHDRVLYCKGILNICIMVLYICTWVREAGRW